MLDCLLAFFLSGLAGSACVDTELGTLNNEETTREGTDFHLQKVSIPGFGLWLERARFAVQPCCTGQNRGHFSRFFRTGGARSIIHSMPGKFLPQETNDER